MKRRIAKKIIQGRSNVVITQDRAINIRSALVGTKYYHIAKTMLYCYLYGGSPTTMKNLITKE